MSEVTQQSAARTAFQAARDQLDRQVIGQAHLNERLLIALLCDGHLLVEGAPGLAKTRAVKCLAALVDAAFHRIQFTPDLLPSDLTGSDIFRPDEGAFRFQQGPLFHNIVLADEINRAPAKVQSALLEAMAERQITVGRSTHPLPPLFLVMATQNPIEQEGTYPLPEAQLDRFLMHVRVDYPAPEVEKEVLRIARQEAAQLLDGRHGDQMTTPILDTSLVDAARREVLSVHLSDPMEEYVIQLVLATRSPGRYDASLEGMVDYGASPRGGIGLERCARARAWLAGRDFVIPEDVQAVAHDVLRHRIIVSYTAEASGTGSDRFIDALIEQVPVP
jgi:MoxR-like ATPase